MRIISQNRCFDLPYETSTLYLQNYDGYTIFAHQERNDVAIFMGTYKTVERAKEIMECIQEEYEFGEKLFYMPGK